MESPRRNGRSSRGASAGAFLHALAAALGLHLGLAPLGAAAQERVEVFHSTQSANLQTAATIRGGLWMLEISHRFHPSFSQGADALWGLDGPVWNRLGLAYGASDRVMVGLLRSNLNDNLELNLKGRVLEGRAGSLPYQVALMAGFALNTEAEGEGIEGNEPQYYGQLIVNAGLGERFAIGVVPTAFRNPRIEDAEPANTFVLGLHGQYYASRSMSLLAEWVMSVESQVYRHDGAAFGLEIETRGHFFKLLATNQVRMNPTQYLVGTPFGHGGDDWRLGFNVTRVLSF